MDVTGAQGPALGVNRPDHNPYQQIAVGGFENHYAMTHFSAAGLTFDARPHVNVFAIVNGVIILVIAEVFREGTRLDEDRSLTI